MIEVVKKPVALDETLKELVEAIRSQNAGQREQRDLLERLVKDSVTDDCLQDVRGELEALNGYQREQRDLLENIAKSVCNRGTISVLLVPVAYDGESYALTSVTVADIRAAMENRIMPVLQIKHGAFLYFVSLSKELTSGTSVIGYQFYTDEHCPNATPGTFTINVEKEIISYNAAEYVTEPTKNFMIRIGDDAPTTVIRERLQIAESVAASLDVGSLG